VQQNKRARPGLTAEAAARMAAPPLQQQQHSAAYAGRRSNSAKSHAFLASIGALPAEGQSQQQQQQQQQPQHHPHHHQQQDGLTTGTLPLTSHRPRVTQPKLGCLRGRMFSLYKQGDMQKTINLPNKVDLHHVCNLWTPLASSA